MINSVFIFLNFNTSYVRFPWKKCPCTVFLAGLICVIITINGLQKETPKHPIQFDNIKNNVGEIDRVNFAVNHYEVCTKPPLTNIAFVKVHKAGSTTVMNILQRFAYQKSLSLVLPYRGHILTDNLSNMIKTSRGKRYNMLINHVHHYDRLAFQRVLYPDSKYIGIVREPLSHIVSAFEYYRYFNRIQGDNPLQEFRKHREKYEPVDAYNSFTNNRMALDFGLSQSEFRNIPEIHKFIRKIDSEFDLVMIMEYFEESLVLLRRLLCWSVRDILFIKKNTNSNKHQTEFTEDERDYHRNFSMADNLLYDHFLDKFNSQLRQQDEEFFEEVEFFRAILEKVKDHCMAPKTVTLIIENSQFSPQFSLGTVDCNLMLLPEIKFVELTKLSGKIIRDSLNVQ